MACQKRKERCVVYIIMSYMIEYEQFIKIATSYMQNRDRSLKPYGYLMYYDSRILQAIFQIFRHHKNICKIIYKDISHKPDEFFINRYEYEAKLFVADMKPRRDEYMAHMAEYEAIVASLADGLSQQTLLSIINAALSMRYDWYEMVMIHGGTQYWPQDIFGLPNEENGETIVDVGGCDGDTYKDLSVKYGKDWFKRYYLYEPDETNVQKAQQGIIDDKVIIRNSAIGNVNSTIKFNPLGGASGRIEEVAGGVDVPIVRLDDDIQEKVSFIKMDIEGAEREAIAGAANHIRNDKPKLAICLYHLSDDIRVIISLIRELNPDYRLYIRHYSPKHKETVLYAI